MTTEGTSGICGVSISVRGSSSIFHGAESPHALFFSYSTIIETMQRSNPEKQRDVPPPCHAHSATRRMQDHYHRRRRGHMILQLGLRRAVGRARRPRQQMFPLLRRTHITVLYQNEIRMFGSGNVLQALHDVRTLDVGSSLDWMRWKQVTISGCRRPSLRGYPRANLVQRDRIAVGGSHGCECF